MLQIRHLALACAAFAAASSVALADINIDFSGLPDGTAVTNQYAGVVFSLEGGPDSSGPPTTNNYGGEALSNSTNPDYPTASILNLAFTAPVSNLSFTFNNQGDPGFDAPTSYTAFDAGNNVISTGDISTINSFTLVTVPGAGIADLQINNNNGGNNWYFSVQEVSATQSLAVTPEPSYLAVLGSALMALVVVRWRKRKAA
jgi:hypothetical protein